MTLLYISQKLRFVQPHPPRTNTRPLLSSERARDRSVDDMQCGTHMERARLEKCMSIAALAEATNIDPQTLSAFEDGSRFPTVRQVDLLESTMQFSFINP